METLLNVSYCVITVYILHVNLVYSRWYRRFLGGAWYLLSYPNSKMKWAGKPDNSAVILCQEYYKTDFSGAMLSVILILLFGVIAFALNIF